MLFSGTGTRKNGNHTFNFAVLINPVSVVRSTIVVN